MCTSFVVNKRKTWVGWNLDLLDMAYRVREAEKGVYIEIYDAKEGWMPLFGANDRGEFVGMPMCWPADGRSDPKAGAEHIIRLDTDLLLEKKSFAEVKAVVEKREICSVEGLTFMGALSDGEGNVLHVVPGQGYRYYEKPTYAVLTNFSPFKMDRERHPWMGWDRYNTAKEMLEKATDDFDLADCIAVLEAVAQTVCPTVVSMAYDVTAKTVYWCEGRRWRETRSRVLGR